MKTLFNTVSVLGLFLIFGSAGGSDMGTLSVTGALMRAAIGVCLLLIGLICTKHCGKICFILGIKRKRRTSKCKNAKTKTNHLSAPRTKDIVTCNTKLF